jgi:hypothetical protein
MQRQPLRLLPLPFILLLLSACTALGLQPAQTFNQKLAYAYGTHTAVLQAATMDVKAGTLKSADAQQILQLSDQAKTILDSATALAASGDTTGATNKLALATAALTALQTYLNTHATGVK